MKLRILVLTTLMSSFLVGDALAHTGVARARARIAPRPAQFNRARLKRQRPTKHTNFPPRFNVERGPRTETRPIVNDGWLGHGNAPRLLDKNRPLAKHGSGSSPLLGHGNNPLLGHGNAPARKEFGTPGHQIRDDSRNEMQTAPQAIGGVKITPPAPSVTKTRN